MKLTQISPCLRLISTLIVLAVLESKRCYRLSAQGRDSEQPCRYSCNSNVIHFPAIRFGFLVGVVGGVPSKHNDIRLGDVVVSIPSCHHGGVVQWDFGKATKGGHFQRTGALNSPPTILKTALSRLEATHEIEGSKVPEYMSYIVTRYPRLSSKFNRPPAIDVLFKADYDHVDDNDTCSACDTGKAVRRPPRDDFVVHYSIIASSNQVMKDGTERGKINKELGGALCFKM
jgi:hypothetical protein